MSWPTLRESLVLVMAALLVALFATGTMLNVQRIAESKANQSAAEAARASSLAAVSSNHKADKLYDGMLSDRAKRKLPAL